MKYQLSFTISELVIIRKALKREPQNELCNLYANELAKQISNVVNEYLNSTVCEQCKYYKEHEGLKSGICVWSPIVIHKEINPNYGTRKRRSTKACKKFEVKERRQNAF